MDPKPDPRLSCLRPSTQPPLLREQVQKLPAGMIVFRRFRENPWGLYQIQQAATEYRSPECRVWDPEGGWSDHTEALGVEVEIRYPRLPRLSVRLTEPAVRERRKTVTRRMRMPGWAKPGRLALVVDRLRTAGAIGLAVVEIVSAGQEQLSSISTQEVRQEGFPRMEPEDFIGLFTQAHGCSRYVVVTRIEWRYL